MSSCAHCGAVILFGGVKHGSWTFCCQKCCDASNVRSGQAALVPNSSCAHCGSVILFGGVKRSSWTFCSQKCCDASNIWLEQVALVPDDLVDELVHETHTGNCPMCGGIGPVDIHVSHRVISLLVMTLFHSTPRMSCQSCATFAKIKDSLITLFLGWWGFPWGVVTTPIYLMRNAYGLICPVSSLEPSQQLKDHLRLTIATQLQQEITNETTEETEDQINDEINDNYDEYEDDEDEDDFAQQK